MLVFVIPLAFTLTFTIMYPIIGDGLPYFETIASLWSKYFFTGSFGNIESWKFHISAFMLCIFITVANEFD